ncbi:MAG: Holliday junction resolvase RuvX [Lachnospiraceae bacterium]|nr:Holliday junction resolvase RuvX [Lachnospiraceae bacterium]
MRAIGLDYGSKTVGVAVSDPFGWTAQAVETITREKENHLRATLRRIEELVHIYEADRIILGLPLNMDDTAGERAMAARAFQETLEKKTGLPVFLWDERLTTAEAEEILKETGVPRAEWKTHVDKIAAVLILQDYLNEQNNR